MTNLLSKLVAIIFISSFTYGEEVKCDTNEEILTEVCVMDHAKRCDKDWSNAISIGGACLSFSMDYDEEKKYESMAIVAYQRAMLMAKYNGGAYMSYYPTVDMDFMTKAENAKFKNLNNIYEKSISKEEFIKYVCGEHIKNCKNKMSVFVSLNEHIFSSTYHPYYDTHPNIEILTKEEQKMLLKKHIEMHIKKSDKKWVDILLKEGKISR